ncbi:MAG: NUDIX hydrolase [Bryobacterales bacterium]
MSSAPFRTLSARTLFRNRWIALEEHEVEAAADGHQFTYTYLSVKPSVMIVAITDEGRIPIIRQYRYPSKAYNYELPGGGSAGRPPEETALAELKEETGYTAGKVEKIGDFITYCAWPTRFATSCSPRESAGLQNTEPTESIEVRGGICRIAGDDPKGRVPRWHGLGGAERRARTARLTLGV